ncbi:hypothetical protein IGI04_042723 [Brassica rapa subsp. trilocularis]|uniref:Uncharacterized protein n=1 Tax=Brassica rapa subsp. trilocularis TaxID=1813537 RepID=A0ABQ7KIP2_BRACM|nr:hypothetical protein IGI04_042723 [Brassica rapa subsp. trilocularis]
MDREGIWQQAVTLEIYHSNFIVTVVTEVKDLGSYLASIWRVKHARRSLDEQGGVWIWSEVLVNPNHLNMEMEHRPESTVKTEEERHGEWSRWAKRALESCGLWSSHGKGKPFMEMATEEGKSKLVRVVEDRGVIRGLRQGKDECYQLVGRLREVWSELDVVKTHTSNPRCCQERRKQDVIFSFLMEEVCELVKYTCDVWEMNRKPERWKGGTSCKRGRLRKLSKEWLMKRRAWRKDSESEHLSDRMSVILKRIKDVLQQMVIGECSYSAYMGETVGDSADMRGKLDTNVEGR